MSRNNNHSEWPFLTLTAELIKLLIGFDKSQAVGLIDIPKVINLEQKQLEDK
jgi:hypothetical protein